MTTALLVYAAAGLALALLWFLFVGVPNMTSDTKPDSLETVLGVTVVVGLAGPSVIIFCAVVSALALVLSLLRVVVRR